MNRCAGLSGTMLVVGLLASAGAAQGHADRRDAEPVKLTDASFLEIDAMVMAAQGRPNEQHRLRGLKDYRQGGYEDAREQFDLAAYHADKYSQHYLSLMFWHGVGVTEDREAVTPDELYGKEGGLARLDKYWQEQDRQLDGTVEVGPVKPVR